MTNYPRRPPTTRIHMIIEMCHETNDSPVILMSFIADSDEDAIKYALEDSSMLKELTYIKQWCDDADYHDAIRNFITDEDLPIEWEYDEDIKKFTKNWLTINWKFWDGVYYNKRTMGIEYSAYSIPVKSIPYAPRQTSDRDEPERIEYTSNDLTKLLLSQK